MCAAFEAASSIFQLLWWLNERSLLPASCANGSAGHQMLPSATTADIAPDLPGPQCTIWAMSCRMLVEHGFRLLTYTCVYMALG